MANLKTGSGSHSYLSVSSSLLPKHSLRSATLQLGHHLTSSTTPLFLTWLMCGNILWVMLVCNDTTMGRLLLLYIQKSHVTLAILPLKWSLEEHCGSGPRTVNEWCSKGTLVEHHIWHNYVCLEGLFIRSRKKIYDTHRNMLYREMTGRDFPVCWTAT